MLLTVTYKLDESDTGLIVRSLCRNAKHPCDILLRCLLSRENLNSTFSASYIEMAITFDALDRLQENKVFQTAQAMNNI